MHNTKETKEPVECSIDVYSTMLRISVGALLTEMGFTSSETAAVATLSEMMQSFLSELSRSSQAYCEVAGRTDPTLSDVIMSMIDMGIDITTIPDYARRSNKHVLLPPQQKSEQHNLRFLRSGGQRKARPSYIPDYLPEFPEPHTYLKTPTQKQPTDEYQAIREKVASQKRDVEKGLTRFIAKTGDTHSIFKDDARSFPLVACKPQPAPYLNALLPREVDIELPVTEKQSDENKQEAGKKDSVEDGIDNPYLRPLKMPKLKKRR